MATPKYITIGEFVAHDYRTASVFTKYGIDFCCRGHRTITEVCERKNIDHAQLLDELTAVLLAENKNAIDFKSWPLDLLVDYIEKKHHRYVEGNIPVILQYLDKLCKTHGAEHPELLEIKSLFEDCGKDLAQHMKKEELILFPFIKTMERNIKNPHPSHAVPFETVDDPIALMMQEHDHEGERFRKIAALSNQYTPPPMACNTYKVTFAMLKDFELDLHEHIHLENNILFPRAKQLESKIVGRRENSSIS